MSINRRPSELPACGRGLGICPLIQLPTLLSLGLRRPMVKKNLNKESGRPISHELYLKQLNCEKEGGISDHIMPIGKDREDDWKDKGVGDS